MNSVKFKQKFFKQPPVYDINTCTCYKLQNYAGRNYNFHSYRNHLFSLSCSTRDLIAIFSILSEKQPSMGRGGGIGWLSGFFPCLSPLWTAVQIPPRMDHCMRILLSLPTCTRFCGFFSILRFFPPTSKIEYVLFCISFSTQVCMIQVYRLLFLFAFKPPLVLLGLAKRLNLQSTKTSTYNHFKF